MPWRSATMRGIAVPTTVRSSDERNVPTSSASTVGRRAPLAAGTSLAISGSAMGQIRIARVDELPPGKGKQLELEALSVTVWNDAGRFAARVARRTRHLAEPSTEATCVAHGRIFDVAVEDSPAVDEEGVRAAVVVIEGEFVVLRIDEAS